MLKGKHILLGVTGGIAAYKIPLLVRDLRRAGASVRVVMTEAAREFVTPLTLSTLSGEEVLVGSFPDAATGSVKAGTWHVTLGRWADAMLIAPATANVIAKLAHGEADNAVTTLALAARCPVVVSPAMDLDMWHHPATVRNIAALADIGYRVLPPEEGELASGLSGPGRMPQPVDLAAALDALLNRPTGGLRGKKVLVTAGPTHEAIDPVRFIGNRSSGRMGFALAAEAAERGAAVTLIAGPVTLPTPRGVRRVDVESAAQMAEAVFRNRRSQDVIIMSAAVADFAPAAVSSRKLKKSAAMELALKATTDILARLGKEKGKTLLVGFALETDHGLANAKKKLKEKRCDFIVLNNPLVDGAGFGTATNVVTIIPLNGKPERLAKMPKRDVASAILDRVARKFARKPG